MGDFSGGAAYVDGDIVPIKDAKISLLDWGFLHSDATYDVVHVWDGAFFRLNDHLDRFHAGISALHMRLPLTRDAMRETLHSCVSATGLESAYVEMIATRGQPAPGSRDPRSCTNRFYAFAIPFVWVSPPDTGLNLVISARERIPAASVDPTVKNYHWLDLVMGQYDAYARGGDTVALLDADGNLTEGPGFNLFAVTGNTLLTPAHGVLKGITRKTILELAAGAGLAVTEGALSPTALRSSAEVFATSTAGGVMPITRVDGHVIASGAAGPVTTLLQERYWALHQDPDYAEPLTYARAGESEH